MARKVRIAVDQHATGATNPHATRGTKGKGAIQILLYIDEAVEHGHASAGWHREFLPMRDTTLFRVIPLEPERYLLRVSFSHSTS